MILLQQEYERNQNIPKVIYRKGKKSLHQTHQIKLSNQKYKKSVNMIFYYFKIHIPCEDDIKL